MLTVSKQERKKIVLEIFLKYLELMGMNKSMIVEQVKKYDCELYREHLNVAICGHDKQHLAQFIDSYQKRINDQMSTCEFTTFIDLSVDNSKEQLAKIRTEIDATLMVDNANIFTDKYNSLSDKQEIFNHQNKAFLVISEHEEQLERNHLRERIINGNKPCIQNDELIFIDIRMQDILNQVESIATEEQMTAFIQKLDPTSEFGSKLVMLWLSTNMNIFEFRSRLEEEANFQKILEFLLEIERGKTFNKEEYLLGELSEEYQLWLRNSRILLKTQKQQVEKLHHLEIKSNELAVAMNEVALEQYRDYEMLMILEMMNDEARRLKQEIAIQKKKVERLNLLADKEREITEQFEVVKRVMLEISSKK